MAHAIITGTDTLTLERVKKHLNIDFADDDEYLNTLIMVSLEAVEGYCRTFFLEREYSQHIGNYLDNGTPITLVTDDTLRPKGLIEVQYISNAVPKVLYVDALSLYNEDNNYYTYAMGRIVIKVAVELIVDVGTDTHLLWEAGLDELPVVINQARLLLIGTYYENRESTTALNARVLPNGVEFILDAYLVPSVA